jgi:hypothetical protein
LALPITASAVKPLFHRAQKIKKIGKTYLKLPIGIADTIRNHSAKPRVALVWGNKKGQ